MPEAIIDGTGSGYLARVGSDNRLWVDATISGAVSLTATIGSESYIPAGSVIITNTVAVSGTLSTTLQSSTTDIGSTGAILSGTETAFIIHNITGGKSYNLTGMDMTGTADGKYTLYHNSDKQFTLRSNATQQNISRSFDSPLSFVAGSVVVTTIHGELLSQSFEGAMHGFEV